MTDPKVTRQHDDQHESTGQPKKNKDKKAHNAAYRKRRKAKAEQLALKMLNFSQNSDLSQAERDSLTHAAQLLKRL